MTKPIPLKPRERRLKGLDEFETPEFVGRMARVQRTRVLIWWSTLLAVTLVGGAIGWSLS
jgi:hypothetical protein